MGAFPAHVCLGGEGRLTPFDAIWQQFGDGSPTYSAGSGGARAGGSGGASSGWVKLPMALCGEPVHRARGR